MHQILSSLPVGAVNALRRTWRVRLRPFVSTVHDAFLLLTPHRSEGSLCDVEFLERNCDSEIRSLLLWNWADPHGTPSLGRTFSKERAAERSFWSAITSATSCSPTGRISRVAPQGMEIAGAPTRLNGSVSLRRAVLTSIDVFPTATLPAFSRGAAMLVVGSTRRSTLLNRPRNEEASFRRTL